MQLSRPIDIIQELSELASILFYWFFWTRATDFAELEGLLVV